MDLLKWANWQNLYLFNFIIQKFAGLKSKHFSQFFWCKVNLRGLRAFILQKVQASVVEEQKKKFCYPSLIFGERWYSYNIFGSLRYITWLISQKKLVKGYLENLKHLLLSFWQWGPLLNILSTILLSVLPRFIRHSKSSKTRAGQSPRPIIGKPLLALTNLGFLSFLSAPFTQTHEMDSNHFWSILMKQHSYLPYFLI